MNISSSSHPTAEAPGLAPRAVPGAPSLEAVKAQGVAVVLDTPPRSETAALEAARVADLVVVPCRPQMVDLETVPVTTQLIVLARDPLAVAVLVGVPPRGQRAEPHTIGHRAAWGDASALGLTVAEYKQAAGPRGRGAAPGGRVAAERSRPGGGVRRQRAGRPRSSPSASGATPASGRRRPEAVRKSQRGTTGTLTQEGEVEYGVQFS